MALLGLFPEEIRDIEEAPPREVEEGEEAVEVTVERLKSYLPTESSATSEG